MARWEGHERSVWSVDTGPGIVPIRYVASGGADRLSFLWTLGRGKPLRAFVGHLGEINCVKFHPNTCMVGTASSDRTCRLFDVRVGRSVRILGASAGGLDELAFSADGRFVATADMAGIVSVWDIPSGKMAGSVAVGSSSSSSSSSSSFSSVSRGQAPVITSLSFSLPPLCTTSPRDMVLAASTTDSDHALVVWDMASIFEQGGERRDARGATPVTFRTRSTGLLTSRFTDRNLLVCGGAMR